MHLKVNLGPVVNDLNLAKIKMAGQSLMLNHNIKFDQTWSGDLWFFRQTGITKLIGCFRML